MRKSNYDKFPFVEVPNGQNCCVQGWSNIADRLKQAISERGEKKTVLVVECYTGIDENFLSKELLSRLSPVATFHAAQAMHSAEKIDALVEPFLGDDPVFGFLSGLKLPQFFDQEKLIELQRQVEGIKKGLVLILGCGATLIAQSDILVYADLSRWEGQLRFRRNETSNLGVQTIHWQQACSTSARFLSIGGFVIVGNGV